MARITKIAILASGAGTNFCALADAVRSGEILNAQVVALICNRPGAKVIAEAQKRQVPVHVLPSAGVAAEVYDSSLFARIQDIKPDLICLAGYMKLLGPALVSAWKGKILNIHPSLLPNFRGLHALKQALNANVQETGCTVHLVTEELDAGPILAQTKLPIFPNDTEETLRQRLQPMEHALYIRAVNAFLQKT